MDNKIDFTLPDPVVVKVTNLLEDALTELKPYLIALTPTERMVMLKMSDKSLPFVEKTCNYTLSDAEFIPPYMDVKQMNADFEAFQQLSALLRIVKQLSDGLDDSAMQAGAESYNNALNYYNSIKQASKMNVPGAKAIHEDLSKRFSRHKAEKEDSINGELIEE